MTTCILCTADAIIQCRCDDGDCEDARERVQTLETENRIAQELDEERGEA